MMPVWVFILFLPIKLAIDTTGILFNENFEGKDPFSKAFAVETGNWDYALQFVSEPVFEGRLVARFEIREDQPLVHNGKRSEVTIVKNLPGNEMWYSFAIYFPTSGFEYDSEREIINQWYQKGSPASSLRVRKDVLYIETGPTPETREQFFLSSLKKDVWHEVVIHFIHSNKSDGLVEVWLNNKKVLIHSGGNMYAGELPKWKLGLYKPAFKFSTSQVKKRIVYFDNIKVGDKTANYEMMRPKNN